MKSLSIPLQWAILLVATVLVTALFIAISLPGATLIGPMLMAIVMGVSGSTIALPKSSAWLAQALTGGVVALAMDATIIDDVVLHWMPMAVSVITLLVGAVVVGLLMERSGKLPTQTGLWGTLPGAAPAMIALSDEFGGDGRYVAVMQYLRVIIVVAMASFACSLVASGILAIDRTGHAAVAVAKEPATLMGTAALVVVALVGGWIGTKARIPGGVLLGPILLGGAINLSGLITLQAPGWMVGIAFAMIGWATGLRFRRDLLLALVKSIPIMLMSTFGLIIISLGSAFLLTYMTGKDLLTTFLATSPGGLDSMTVIAMGVDADVPFILTLQTLRLFATILVSVLLVRVIRGR